LAHIIMTRIQLTLLTLCSLLFASTAAALTLTFDEIGFVHGSVVADQYEGLSITAVNFNRSFHYAVAFDSNASSTRDPDLEAASGGPTSWSGGNLEGEDLGIMLIIQENDDDDGCSGGFLCSEPDDEGRRAAGTLTFDFGLSPVSDFGFDLIDVESTTAENGQVTFFSGDDEVSISFMDLLLGFELGDNTANRILPFAPSFGDGLDLTPTFDRIVIELGGSGAVDNITFTPVPQPSTAFLLSLGLTGLAWSVRRQPRARPGF
jgi:hypothetical protein